MFTQAMQICLHARPLTKQHAGQHGHHGWGLPNGPTMAQWLGITHRHLHPQTPWVGMAGFCFLDFDSWIMIP